MGILEDMLKGQAQERATYAPFWPDQPNLRKLEPIMRSRSSLATITWDLTLFPMDSYEILAPEIKILAQNSMEDNLFIEPAFALAGLQRIEHSGAMLLCLWEEFEKARKLRFFMPVTVQKAGLPRRRLLKNYTHHFAPLGTPLLHRENTGESMETLLRLLGDPALELPKVLVLDWQRMDGAVVGLLRQAATRLGLQFESALVHQRALLAPDRQEKPEDEPYIRAAMGKKRFRESRRQLRKLQELGAVSFEVATRSDEVLNAVEGFLTLEARGWKGRSGTALYSLKQIAAFSRQAVSSLAAEGRCTIYTMKLDGHILASLICFNSSGEYYSWKTAFDEEYRNFSPGVQILIRATGHMLSLSKFSSTDSLAVAEHNLMDHVWRERQNIGSILVGIGTGSANSTIRAASAIERYNRIKQQLKSALGLFR